MRYILTLAVILAGCTCAGEPSGKVFLTSVPQGASIFTVVGDVKTDTGKKTPALLYLPLGNQKVELVLAGYVPATVVATVDGQAIAKPSSAQLEQAKTPVDVILQDGDGFTVYCDGKPLKDANGQAATTPCTVELPVGPHAIALAKEGFQDIAQKIEARAGMDPVTIKIKPSKGTSALLGIPKEPPPQAKIGDFSAMVGTWTYGTSGTLTLLLKDGVYALAQECGSHSLSCTVTKDKLIFPWSSGGMMVLTFTTARDGLARCWYNVTQDQLGAETFVGRGNWSNKITKKP